jgi:hypothetical protein
MSCSGCETRLTRLLAFCGFSRRIEGGWERQSRTGLIVLDLKPRHHTRAALIALCVWLFQGKAGANPGMRTGRS